jgi:hypothetical protein
MTRPAFFLAIVGLLSISVMGQLENERDKLESKFGKAVDNKGFLYQYNDDYMVKFCFDKRTSHIMGFSLAPKSFFKAYYPQRSDEPDFDISLHPTDYEAVLTKIGEIWPIGDLKETSTVAFVTNSRGRWIDVYEHAVAERAQRGTGKGEVDFSNVWFFRPIQGVVEETASVYLNPKLHISQVKIGEYWYWTPFDYTHRKHSANLVVAGPISEKCSDF